MLGLEWDTSFEDYVLYYFKVSHKKNIKLLSDGDEERAKVEHTPFKTVYQEKRGRREVQQAGLADAPEPHTFHITWE